MLHATVTRRNLSLPEDWQVFNHYKRVQAVSSARRRLSFNIIIDIATINNHTLDWEGFADDTSCSITASGLITGVVELVPNLLTNTYWKK